MRGRFLVGFTVATVAAFVLAGPASAAPGQVVHHRFSGITAQAQWEVSSATNYRETFVWVLRSTQGDELRVFQYSSTNDADGRFTGSTFTTVDVTSGFTFTIDRARLSLASVSGAGLPATTCVLDQDSNSTCADTTLDVSAAWTGQGPIRRDVFNEHVNDGAYRMTLHSQGTYRNATAHAAVGEFTYTAVDLLAASLTTTKTGQMTLCVGGDCG